MIDLNGNVGEMLISDFDYSYEVLFTPHGSFRAKRKKEDVWGGEGWNKGADSKHKLVVAGLIGGVDEWSFIGFFAALRGLVLR